MPDMHHYGALLGGFQSGGFILSFSVPPFSFVHCVAPE